LGWMDACALRANEKVVDSWEGTREVVRESFDNKANEEGKNHDKVMVRERRDGLLVLTNQRLLFLEAQEPYGKPISESVKISLIDVDKILFEKGPNKSTQNEQSLIKHFFLLKKVRSKRDFKSFQKLLEEYCQRRHEQIAKESRKTFHIKIS
jgi:hypothetical protein